MRKFVASAAMILGLAGATYAADASADDTTVTEVAPAVTAKAPPQTVTCGSLEDFDITSRPGRSRKRTIDRRSLFPNALWTFPAIAKQPHRLTMYGNVADQIGLVGRHPRCSPDRSRQAN
jgi:hypothetical protein